MKWEEDLLKDIRTHTEYDDYDQDEYRTNQHQYNHAEVTDCNRENLLQQFNKVRENAKAILEIGIGRNADQSFAYVFFNNKKKDTFYVGIDIEDRSFLNNPQENIYTIVGDSSDYEKNSVLFKAIGVQKFDFIFIDGWHSINQVLKDWEYTNLLADGGIVGFHDTTCHPGPYNFITNLDPEKWDVIENACPEDWGVGFARKK